MKKHRLLKSIIPKSYREILIGDIEEEYTVRIKHYSKTRTGFWYIKEIIKSFPSFLILHLLEIKNKRRQNINLLKNSTKFAVAGMISIFPALLIVVSGIFIILFRVESLNNLLDEHISKTNLNIIIHPVVVFGGLILAIILNFHSSLEVKLQFETNSVISKVSLKGKLINLLIASFGLLLLALLLVYGFVENFVIVPRFH